ncbi:flagellar protein FlaG [Fervidibacillus halotolerans]|uniref:Flagellar protein FlaG n=1 Tax=Fervidibacillus halotolerans TaxID=2980027 RepID=A0A9E8RYA1_9BACI|nr:flagellar protein FlaG [Fervidibacillus halotolerans]WAA12018.1 flagellar protein FlaG [Fervidibacillus halotolerans]
MIEKVSSQQHVITTMPGVRSEGKGTELQEKLEYLTDKEQKEMKGYLQSENKKQIKELVNGLNEFLTPVHTSLKFELHEKLNEYYVTIIDDNTKEVIKEIPPKKLLDLYAAMAEQLGIIVDKKI